MSKHFPGSPRKEPPSTVVDYNKAGKTRLPNPYGPQKEPAKSIKNFNRKRSVKFPK